MPNYNPTNCYWVVAGSTTQVWSSSTFTYVPLTDATYVAWLAEGNLPSKIGSILELVEVMSLQVLPSIMTTVQITSTATPALNGTYAISAGSQSNIIALSTGIAAGKPLPGGGSTFNYADATGTQHAFTSANFLDFASAIEGFIYNLGQAIGEKVAGGSNALPSSTLVIA
jgi:hypothetical protein